MNISIITPSFNQAGFIERTIESVLNQVVDVPVTHFVVDGGSKDGTVEILRRYSPKIRYVSEPDEGMQEALNKGFSAAEGDIIGWLNSDDIYLPGALQKVADYFAAHPDVGWLYGNCRIIDENDREIRKWVTAYKNRLARQYRYNRLLTDNFISQPAVFIRKEALCNVGFVDTGLPTAMDYDLWLRLGKMGNPGYIDADLACFRVHNRSISSRSYQAQFNEQYRIHARYDKNRWRLMKHLLKNRMIVIIYSLLSFGRKIG